MMHAIKQSKGIKWSLYDLVATSPTTGDIYLQWKDVANATKYMVEYREAGQTTWYILSTGHTSSEMDLSNNYWGVDGEEFEFRVRAFNGYSPIAPYSEIASVVVKPPRLGNPGISVSVNSNDVLISWNAVNKANGYVLTRYADGETYADRVEIYRGSNTSYLDENLSAGRYWYTVYAVDTNGVYPDGTSAGINADV